MKRFVVYDDTGNIIGRYLLNSAAQEAMYPNKVEIDQATYEAQPELFSKVDTGTRKFVRLTDEEIAAKMGGNALADAQKAGDGFIKVISDAAILDNK